MSKLLAILTSSEFLKMHRLVNECLDHFRDNGLALLRSPVDFELSNYVFLYLVFVVFPLIFPRIVLFRLDANKLLSIFISSEFLKMHRLGNECLDYFRDNAAAVLNSLVELELSH